MRLLSDLKVGVRLGLGFALLVLLMLAMGAFCASRVSQVQAKVDDLADNWLPSTQKLGQIGESMNQMRRAELQMLVGGDAKAVADEAARLVQQWTVLPRLLQDYDGLVASERERQAFDTLRRQLDTYHRAQDRYVAAFTQGRRDEAVGILRGDSRTAFRGATDSLAALVGLAEKNVKLDPDVPLRAAWVDRHSVAGYLLPQAYLKSKGIVPATSAFLGSYLAALEEVLEDRADLAATWASGAAAQPTEGFRELLGEERAKRLQVLAYTPDCPNDAIVFSPHLQIELGENLLQAFLAMPGRSGGPMLLRSVFGAERFDVAPAGAFGPRSRPSGSEARRSPLSPHAPAPWLRERRWLPCYVAGRLRSLPTPHRRLRPARPPPQRHHHHQPQSPRRSRRPRPRTPGERPPRPPPRHPHRPQGQHPHRRHRDHRRRPGF